MKIFKKFDRASLGKTPLEFIRESIPEGNAKIITRKNSRCEFLYIGDVKVDSFNSGFHYIHTGKWANYKVRLAFADGRVKEEELEKMNYRKIDECFIIKKEEDFDFSELENMLSRSFDKFPYVRVENIADMPGMYKASLFEKK